MMNDTSELPMTATEDLATADVPTQPEGLCKLRRPSPEEIAAAIESVETVTLPRTGEA